MLNYIKHEIKLVLNSCKEVCIRKGLRRIKKRVFKNKLFLENILTCTQPLFVFILIYFSYKVEKEIMH